jgi:16S rRNA (cytosine1402-N4)-methyltransferase
MDPTHGMAAEEWLQQVSEGEIIRVLRDYGEEKYARRIAKAIVLARQDVPISTTGQLSAIISEAVPTREKKKHPATRSFQAIRIFLNNELEELSSGLDQAFRLLRIGGRLVVISFHSLEDRIVKRFMRELSQNDPYPKDIPVKAETIKPKLKIIGKPIRPSDEEIALNPRARSASLRIAEKLSI